MQRVLAFATIGLSLLAGAAAASAQRPAPSSPDQHGRPLTEQRATEPTTRPLFFLFGVPVGVNAPVAAPYCGNCALQNYGGQPDRSRTAVARAATGLGQ
jgi:hypothetical protein